MGSLLQEGRTKWLWGCPESGELSSAAGLIQTGCRWATPALSSRLYKLLGFFLLAPLETPLVGTDLPSICICYLFVQISPGTPLSLQKGFPFCLSNSPSYWSDPAPRLEGFTPTFSSPTAAINAQHVSDWQRPNAGFQVQTHRSPQPCKERLSRRHKSGNHIYIPGRGLAEGVKPTPCAPPAVCMPSKVQLFVSGFPAQQYT